MRFGNDYRRLHTLVRRAIEARRLGLWFIGTSHFRPPMSAMLGRGRRALSLPDDPALAHAVIEVWLDDDYGLAGVTKPVRTVLDIGANVGLFALWAWHHFPQARIHSYEPNPALQRHLASNLGDLSNITVWAEGVSGRSGSAHFDPGSGTMLGQTKADKEGAIPLVAIEKVMERIGGEVDLMKLDCEGAEWEIFQDVEAFRNVRELRMEYHLTEGRDLNDLRAAARRLGFEITYLRENQAFGTAHLRNCRTIHPVAPKS